MNASPALDIWALGCILYALVVGQVPFYNKSEKEIERMVCEDDLQFPKKNFVSEELQDLLEKMLEKDSEKRIQMNAIRIHPWVLEKSLGLEEVEKRNMERMLRLEKKAALLKAKQIKEEEERSESYKGRRPIKKKAQNVRFSASNSAKKRAKKPVMPRKSLMNRVLKSDKKSKKKPE